MRATLAPLLAVLLLGSAAQAFDIPPPPPRMVYDGAGVLRPEEKAALEDRLLQLYRQYDLPIGVAIFPSLEGESLEDVSLRIADAWMPGGGGKKQRALLSAFIKDRKVRIETGYALEDRVTDAVSARIIREQLAPEFREGNYGEGIRRAVDGIAAAALGQAPPEPSPRATPVRRRQTGGGGFLCVALVIFFIFSSLIRSARRPRMYGRRRGAPGMPWWAWMLLGSQMSGHRRRGGWGDGGGWGGGGGFGGGGGGGGGFGGGGFGGGGGSSFGGGGSSGGW